MVGKSELKSHAGNRKYLVSHRLRNTAMDDGKKVKDQTVRMRNLSEKFQGQFCI